MINGVNFTYRSGSQRAPFSTNEKNIAVLVLDGSNQKQAQDKLDFLKPIHRLILVVHGSPDCRNEWLVPQLKSRGGSVDAIFLTRDSVAVDDHEIFRWPMGV